MSIPQEVKYRLKTIKYAERFGVAKAAANYHTSEKNIYRWKKILSESNGNYLTLANQSRRPHSHPNAHTETEIKLVKDMRRRNPNIGLQDFWLKLRARGYTRTQPALLKLLKRLEMPTNPKSKPSPTCRKSHRYEPAQYPGQKLQIDVKYVPMECLSAEFKAEHPGERLYQYTAIDEYSRYRILCGYREHNTYSSSLFLCQVNSSFKALGIEVECVQTDNGAEFTKQFLTNKNNNHSMFENTARRFSIRLKRIKPGTPKHNGKVERLHREDQKLFYSEMVRLNRLITDENDFKRRLKRHQDKTNNRPMRPLNFMTPKQVLEAYKNKAKK